VNIGKRCCHKNIDTPEQMLLWHPIIEPGFIEKACLIVPPPTHHSCLVNLRISGITVRRNSQDLFDSIGQKET
jgi:hypothetical protein